MYSCLLSCTFHLTFSCPSQPAGPASLLLPPARKHLHTFTFAGLAICLQLEAVVAVAGGPVECGDTVVLAAQLRTVASELCGGGRRHMLRPSDLAATPRLQLSPNSRQPFRNHIQGLQCWKWKGFRKRLLYFARGETETQGGYDCPSSHSQL